MLKGVIHIHSTYSDGEFTLRDLREVYLDAGCSFAFMTDHAEAFDTAKLDRYLTECESLSDENFRFIAGLEFECERRMHVLGLGAPLLARTTDPQRVIRHIKNCGGLSVIAHPMDSMFEWIESFDSLPDGIETWNSKYDGRYAPRPGTFRLLNKLQERREGMLAFYGQDMHWRNQYRGLFNIVEGDVEGDVEGETLSREAVLSSIGNGRYTAEKDSLHLPSNGRLPRAVLDSFAIAHARSTRRRGWIKTTKRALDRAGVRVPASVKARLRRIF